MAKGRFSYFFAIVMIVIALGLLLLPSDDETVDLTPVGETPIDAPAAVTTDPVEVGEEPTEPESDESGDFVEGSSG